jgi:hypothetical protein
MQKVFGFLAVKIEQISSLERLDKIQGTRYKVQGTRKAQVLRRKQAKEEKTLREF